MRKIQGFTLIEVMVTVAIVAILAAIGTPSLKEFLDASKVKSETQRVAGLFSIARNHAITNSQAVIVFGTVADGALDIDVYTDSNGDNTLTYEAGDTYIEQSDGPDVNLNFGSNIGDNAVVFNAQGRSDEGAVAIVTICNIGNTVGRQVSVSIVGRASITELTNPGTQCL